MRLLEALLYSCETPEAAFRFASLFYEHFTIKTRGSISRNIQNWLTID